MKRETIMIVWISILTILSGFLLWDKYRSVRSFDELSVHRLNVIESNGLPRIIISNKEKFPGLYIGGKEYAHPTRDFGGMIFYNSEGDEIGGIAFDASETEDGYNAIANFAFDQFRQDQTVTLAYIDENGDRITGLRIDDQPETPILPLVKMNAKISEAETGTEIDSIREEMRAYVQEHRMHTERAFIGTVKNESSILKLSDRNGRPRIICEVDSAGNPSLSFFDDEGREVLNLPDGPF